MTFAGVHCILTRPSLGMMLVRWTTSRWADCETRESDDREMMWSQIPAKVLHWEESEQRKKKTKQKVIGCEPQGGSRG